MVAACVVITVVCMVITARSVVITKVGVVITAPSMVTTKQHLRLDYYFFGIISFSFFCFFCVANV